MTYWEIALWALMWCVSMVSLWTGIKCLYLARDIKGSQLNIIKEKSKSELKTVFIDIIGYKLAIIHGGSAPFEYKPFFKSDNICKNKTKMSLIWTGDQYETIINILYLDEIAAEITATHNEQDIIKLKESYQSNFDKIDLSILKKMGE